MELLNRFKKFIADNYLFSEKDKLLLAVSGGVDSVVLCELCKQAGYDFAIAHCNFQLRGEDSNRDEQFVKELAGKYRVMIYSKTFDTKIISQQEKKSIEETARDLRYAWFEELRTQNPENKIYSWIVTAHHADDNIETIAMKFFRGTGIKGLRGMLPKTGKIVRPLLFARKSEIEDFAWAAQLKFVEDHTNYENAYARNFFRNRLIPLLKAVYPGVEQNLLKNIERFSEVEELYNQAVSHHKKELLESKGNEVHIPVLKLKKTQPLRSVLYEIVKEYGFSSQQVNELIGLLDSESGKYVQSSTHRVIKNRNWLIIAPNKTGDAGTILIESEMTNVVFEAGSLKIEMTNDLKPATSNMVACIDAKEISFPLILRKWKTGDYFYPLGMKKKKKLSRFFIDRKLSKTEKEKIWVIESDKKIIWVVGRRIDERFKITEKTKSVLKIELTGA